jgi:GGDEF domain-containing protein
MMESTTDRDHLLELSTTVSCYLSLLSAVGECVGVASPDVGGPYRKRIEQLRTRVFFQSSPKAIKGSLKIVEGELNDYAAVAAQFLDQHDLDLRRTIVTLEHGLDKLAICRSFHGAQLLELAERVEASELAGELRHRVESMNREMDSTQESIRREMAAAEERLRGSGSTDPSTGLLNAREIKRQMEAYRDSGVAFSLLRFEMHGTVTEPVMKQAAGRIEKQFRHRDRIARWSDTEFLVLFQGPEDVAETRASQVAKLLAGRYDLTTGGQVEIAVHSQLADREVALA